MESVTRILMEHISEPLKSAPQPQKLVCTNNSILKFSDLVFISHFLILLPTTAPGVVTGVQGTYPYVVWNPPEQPNGVITGYRLTFTRSGTSRSITADNDQTFYTIQSSDIPWTSGSFSVSVSEWIVNSSV